MSRAQTVPYSMAIDHRSKAPFALCAALQNISCCSRLQDKQASWRQRRPGQEALLHQAHIAALPLIHSRSAEMRAFFTEKTHIFGSFDCTCQHRPSNRPVAGYIARERASRGGATERASRSEVAGWKLQNVSSGRGGRSGVRRQLLTAVMATHAVQPDGADYSELVDFAHQIADTAASVTTPYFRFRAI